MFENITNLLTIETNLLLNLTFFTTIMVLYAIFVFYFYRFLARKNILELNLNQYNQYKNPTLIKIFAAIFYIIEYIVLMPILTFFWFGVLSILTLMLAKDLTISTVLLISAALVTSVRITAYISEDLAKDLAKMIPFTLLAIAITTAGFFEIGIFFDRVSQIPSLFSHIPYYLLFIVSIEMIMRLTEFIQSVFQNSNAMEDSFDES
jgi:hypothetical protein